MGELTIKAMDEKNQNLIIAAKNYGKRLFSYIRRNVSTNEDAEDILQDIWFQLSVVIDTEPIEHLSSWLYKVGKNRVIDKKRKHSALLLDDFAYENEDGETIFPSALIEDNNSPEKQLENKLTSELLMKAIDELPPKQKQVFIQNELEDMTLKEIAQQSGESIKTIISRKRYAVQFLRKRLKNLYKDYK
jgi:RNA polymerase sigma factor (sigma-70 family)